MRDMQKFGLNYLSTPVGTSHPPDEKTTSKTVPPIIIGWSIKKLFPDAPAQVRQICYASGSTHFQVLVPPSSPSTISGWNSLPSSAASAAVFKSPHKHMVTCLYYLLATCKLCIPCRELQKQKKAVFPNSWEGLEIPQQETKITVPLHAQTMHHETHCWCCTLPAAISANEGLSLVRFQVASTTWV